MGGIDRVEHIRLWDAPMSESEQKIKRVENHFCIDQTVVVKFPEVFDSGNTTLVVLEYVLLDRKRLTLLRTDTRRTYLEPKPYFFQDTINNLHGYVGMVKR